MDWSRLRAGEAWMTVEEKQGSLVFIEGMHAFLKRLEIQDNPLVILRVNDVLISYLLVRRMEEALAYPEEGAAGDKEAFRTPPSVVEQIGKGRERMRKSMKELEEMVLKSGNGASGGLADQIRPIMHVAKDLMQEVLETPACAGEAESIPPSA